MTANTALDWLILIMTAAKANQSGLQVACRLLRHFLMIRECIPYLSLWQYSQLFEQLCVQTRHHGLACAWIAVEADVVLAGGQGPLALLVELNLRPEHHNSNTHVCKHRFARSWAPTYEQSCRQRMRMRHVIDARAAHMQNCLKYAVPSLPTWSASVNISFFTGARPVRSSSFFRAGLFSARAFHAAFSELLPPELLAAAATPVALFTSVGPSVCSTPSARGCNAAYSEVRGCRRKANASAIARAACARACCTA
jgi:hypothetical protein